MPDIVINNFKGKYEKASEFSLPTVYANTCKNLLPTHEGMLKKRSGYEDALLNNVAFATTGLVGNIINMFELVTGRPATTAPNEAIKYLCMTDSKPGKIYVWNDNTLTWVQIDNSLTDFRNEDDAVVKCRFLVEDGTVRILAGPRSVNLPLWWGYVDQRFAHAISANDGTETPIAGSFLTNAVLANIGIPGISDLSSSSANEPSFATWESCINGLDFPDTHTRFFFFKISYQYDNKQWSPPSDLRYTTGNVAGEDTQSRKRILITMDSTTMNRRITGIKLFRTAVTVKSIVKEDFGIYRLFATININADYGDWDTARVIWPYDGGWVGGTYASATKRFKLVGSHSDDDALADDMLNGALLLAKDTVTQTVYTCRIADTISTDAANQWIEVADGTGLVDTRSYQMKVVKGWIKNGTDYQYFMLDDVPLDGLDAMPSMYTELGITRESYTDVNAKYGVMINGQAFYGNCYHVGEQKAYIVAYGMYTVDGLFGNDVHHALNAFSSGADINGMSAVGDRIILYSPYSIQRGIIPGANESTWDFERVYEKYGLLAEDSLVNIHGRDYFLASDWTVKEFDGQTAPRSISGGIYDTLHDAGQFGLEYLKAVKGFFMPKLNMYVILIQVGIGTYEYWGYDLNHSNVGWVQLSYSTFSGFFLRSDGYLTAYDFDEVWTLNEGTDDDGTAIAPEYKTIKLSSDRKFVHHLSQVIMTYKSNTAIQFDIYLDNAASAHAALTFPAASTVNTVSANVPLATNGRSFQIHMYLTTANKATNTSFEIHEIIMPVEVSGGGI